MKTDSLDEILDRYPPQREHLISILQDVQEKEGYLSREAIVRIADYLKMATGKIYGVATFYNQFRFQSSGKFHIMLCRGTACHVKGSSAVLACLEKELGIHPGETSGDGLFSLEITPCLGACGLAPVMSVNGEIHSCVDEYKVKTILADLRASAATEGEES